MAPHSSTQWTPEEQARIAICDAGATCSLFEAGNFKTEKDRGNALGCSLRVSAREDNVDERLARADRIIASGSIEENTFFKCLQLAAWQGMADGSEVNPDDPDMISPENKVKFVTWVNRELSNMPEDIYNKLRKFVEASNGCSGGLSNHRFLKELLRSHATLMLYSTINRRVVTGMASTPGCC